jgi:hypothetical protein
MQIMRSAQVIDKLQFGAIAFDIYCGQNYYASGYCAISIHPYFDAKLRFALLASLRAAIFGKI